MPAFVQRTSGDALRVALEKLAATTPITAIGPGSVARALTEVVTTELDAFYSIMDYNTSLNLVSTAQGRALDLIAQLYNIERKRLTELATIDEQIGSFYFYIDEPHTQDISIASGTRVLTSVQDYVAERYTYVTTKTVTIGAGRLRAYAPLRPEFNDSIFTAGKDTLVVHTVPAFSGPVLRCTNPKPIAQQLGLETDDNFRARVIKEVRASAGGTVDALRFRGLSINGVRDVKVRTSPYGLGTAEVLIVPEDSDPDGSILRNVTAALETVSPVGVTLYVRQPNYTNLDLEATIFIRPDVDVNPAGTARRAEVGIQRFANRLLPGDTLVYTQLIQSILDASDAILDVRITSMRIAGTEVLRRNYKSETDQQIVYGNITVRPAT